MLNFCPSAILFLQARLKMSAVMGRVMTWVGRVGVATTVVAALSPPIIFDGTLCSLSLSSSNTFDLI